MAPEQQTVSASEVRRIVGNIDADKVRAILALRPTAAEIEEAVAWAEGESDVMGELERPSSPTIGAIYDLLMTEVPQEERREGEQPD